MSMDEQSLRKNYQEACKILGFDIRGCEERLKAYKDMDDYRITFLDLLWKNEKASDAFLEAYRLYCLEPEKFKEIFE